MTLVLSFDNALCCMNFGDNSFDVFKIDMNSI